MGVRGLQARLKNCICMRSSAVQFARLINELLHHSTLKVVNRFALSISSLKVYISGNQRKPKICTFESAHEPNVPAYISVQYADYSDIALFTRLFYNECDIWKGYVAAVF